MFNIIEKRKIFFTISICIIVIGIISLIFRGFNFDIDFTGGTQMTVNLGQEFNNDDISSIVNGIIGETPVVQKAADPVTGANTSVIIKTKELSTDQRTQVYNAIADKYGVNVNDETLFTINFGKDVSSDDLTSLVNDTLKFAPLKVTVEDGYAYIKTNALTDDGKALIQKAIADKYGIANDGSVIKVSDLKTAFSSDNISADVGSDLKSSAIWSAIIAIGLMMIYISFRFEFLSGVACVVSLIHDALILITVYTVFQIPINLTFIAAVLTVLGFSNSDTVVIFDRIRENVKNMKKITIAEVVNISVWQTFRRSCFTGLAALITIGALYIVGVPSIKQFAFPIIIGIVFGIYSSIFVAAEMWVIFVNGKNRKA